MRNKPRVGFVCFGEVNTPWERLEILQRQSLETVRRTGAEVLEGGIVLDDEGYHTADRALEALRGQEIDCLLVCVAGWVPTHAVIRVTDPLRHLPMLLWGVCGWEEDGRIVTTAGQAGTTALRPAFEAMDYRYKFVYSVIGKPAPLEAMTAYLRACYARNRLRAARVGTMGYRDMLLYGTGFECNSMRGQLGVEVEPFEMLEMVQGLEALDPVRVAEGVSYVKANWTFEQPCDDAVLEQGVRYALAIRQKVERSGWEAVTLLDVDGMKKLLGFPPAMVFMLLDHYCGVQTTPENDVAGCVTQLMLSYLSGGGVIPYLEYYEFFEDSMLIGVPDYVPRDAVAGEVTVLPTAFGLLNASLLNVSKVRTGYVTCARLIYRKGRYRMHLYTGQAEEPPRWEEYGWAQPAPQLPSLRVRPDSCTVPEFAQRVSSQHVLVCYGDHREAMEDLCGLLDIDVI